ncbi:MAG: T9SS type A sorting domain-containing protein [Cytophagaceae bacterium]|nr:T9SS type A sorting domain-containing protein [Cytophagaceae bacterium]
MLFNDYAAPFTFTWTNVAAGTYTITARATDNSGAGTTSSAITITVVNVVNNTCASIAQYIENAGYAAGSKVKNNGRQYECKPYPYSGWCNGAAWAYGPGSGAYWSDAWLDKGSCTARSAADLVGINDAQVSEVFLSPNPATDVITIHSDLASTVRVFNVQGMEVMTETSVNANGILHVSELAAGIYYIRIDTGNELVTKAIIKK